MAAVGAEGNRKWHPFDGDCEYSVPLGRGMEYVEGKRYRIAGGFRGPIFSRIANGSEFHGKYFRD